MPNTKINAAAINMKGEERFGPVLSRAYNLFALGGALGIYRFACKDILSKKGRFSLLDVGTGPGILPKMLSADTKRIRIYAVDPSPSMLRIAMRNNKNPESKFAIGHSQKLPFDAKFDLIISSVSFHHWAHKKESLVYLSKFLKQRGEIRVYELLKKGRFFDYFVDMHRMNKEELQKAASGTGLAVRSIKIKGGFIRAVYARERTI